MKLKLPNGYDFVALPGSEFIINEIWRDRCYDLGFDVRPGAVVVDLGANQGIYSLYAASKGATVYAVEPEPETFALLTNNVADNHLTKQVVSLNYAVGAITGTVELFVPQTDRVCASGLVMTSRDQRRVIESIPDVTIETVSCKSITLSDLLRTEIPPGPIDLLKIDCEGAELEILKGASADECARIGSLVVETHDVYREQDLFYAVKELGFAVTHYQKIKGNHPPRIGLLLATRKPAATWSRPVAVMKVPGAVQVGDEIVLDGSASFSTVSKTAPLTFRWRVDGCERDESFSCLRLRAEAEGRHDFALSVFDGDLADAEERHVWCHVPLGKDQEVQYLEDQTKAYIAQVKDERPVHFAIKKDCLCRTWQWRYENLVVGVEVPRYPKERKMSSSTEEEFFNDWYRQITFRHVRPEEDFHFVLRGLNPGSRVQVCWWPIGEGNASNPSVASSAP